MRGHGTAYSDYQVHTPFVIRWPGRLPARITCRTSHNDLVPTLLTEPFGCANPPCDYASGWDLFSEAQWSWLVAASYREFAVIEPKWVTIVFPAGYVIRERDCRLVGVQSPPRGALRAAMHETIGFHR